MTQASWTECVSRLSSLQPWDAERCLVQFEKDGVIQTQEKSQRQHNGLSYSHSWTSQQKVSLTTHSINAMLEYPSLFTCAEKFYISTADLILIREHPVGGLGSENHMTTTYNNSHNIAVWLSPSFQRNLRLKKQTIEI